MGRVRPAMLTLMYKMWLRIKQLKGVMGSMKYTPIWGNFETKIITPSSTAIHIKPTKRAPRESIIHDHAEKNNIILLIIIVSDKNTLKIECFPRQKVQNNTWQ